MSRRNTLKRSSIEGSSRRRRSIGPLDTSEKSIKDSPMTAPVRSRGSIFSFLNLESAAPESTSSPSVSGGRQPRHRRNNFSILGKTRLTQNPHRRSSLKKQGSSSSVLSTSSSVLRSATGNPRSPPVRRNGHRRTLSIVVTDQGSRRQSQLSTGGGLGELSAFQQKERRDGESSTDDDGNTSSEDDFCLSPSPRGEDVTAYEFYSDQKEEQKVMVTGWDEKDVEFDLEVSHHATHDNYMDSDTTASVHTIPSLYSHQEEPSRERLQLLKASLSQHRLSELRRKGEEAQAAHDVRMNGTVQQTNDVIPTPEVDGVERERARVKSGDMSSTLPYSERRIEFEHDSDYQEGEGHTLGSAREATVRYNELTKAISVLSSFHEYEAFLDLEEDSLFVLDEGEEREEEEERGEEEEDEERERMREREGRHDEHFNDKSPLASANSDSQWAMVPRGSSAVRRPSSAVSLHSVSNSNTFLTQCFTASGSRPTTSVVRSKHTLPTTANNPLPPSSQQRERRNTINTQKKRSQTASKSRKKKLSKSTSSASSVKKGRAKTATTRSKNLRHSSASMSRMSARENVVKRDVVAKVREGDIRVALPGSSSTGGVGRAPLPMETRGGGGGGGLKRSASVGQYVSLSQLQKQRGRLSTTSKSISSNVSSHVKSISDIIGMCLRVVVYVGVGVWVCACVRDLTSSALPVSNV